MEKRALYFGCRGAREPGHFLQEGSKTLWVTPSEIEFWDHLMDGGLLKNGKRDDVPDGRVWWTCGGKLGLWYAFYWWDRSGDRRSSSNSGFYVSGFGPDVITPESTRSNALPAFQFACQSYPRVIERQHHLLVLQV